MGQELKGSARVCHCSSNGAACCFFGTSVGCFESVRMLFQGPTHSKAAATSEACFSDIQAKDRAIVNATPMQFTCIAFPSVALALSGAPSRDHAQNGQYLFASLFSPSAVTGSSVSSGHGKPHAQEQLFHNNRSLCGTDNTQSIL